ncbi:hypothetical protein B0T26DRAFT_728067 [Lasiosphaeria miniovina]|uniref:Transmembrane protein n=1 Tax=Lasiosphaeria miniovina TaxID=1954250 RepID=A0AA40DML3_9PEZI|nr:uncharacterized protein B0T26DRAFT_728067 [Lasiosphaeria miniovina]KAK0706791.1 hypothetical protein B0T26DRAFT_728067 [Lasiosphaeria miniovina]
MEKGEPTSALPTHPRIHAPGSLTIARRLCVCVVRCILYVLCYARLAYGSVCGLEYAGAFFFGSCSCFFPRGGLFGLVWFPFSRLNARRGSASNMPTRGFYQMQDLCFPGVKETHA